MNERIFSVDIETTGLRWDSQVLSVSMGFAGESPRSFNVGMHTLFHTPEVAPMASALLDGISRADLVAVHNASFDLPYLHRLGALPWNAIEGKLLDTLAIARVTKGRDNGASLASLAEEYGIGAGKEWYAMKGKRGGLDKLDPETVLNYAGDDVLVTGRLALQLVSELQQEYGEDWRRVVSVVGNHSVTVSKMRCNGLQLRPTVELLAYRNEVNNTLNAAMRVVLKYNISNVNSDQDVTLGLERIGVKVSSIAEDDLRAVTETPEQRELVDNIVISRHAVKVLGTWIDGMLDQVDQYGRVHPLFNSGGTVSGRLSCTQPNVQAIPKDVRARILGDRIEVDYAQAELRLAAAYAKEENAAKAFASGRDIHAETAQLMFGEVTPELRTLAKRCNFGSIYRAGRRAIAEAAGVDEARAGELLQLHRKVYPGMEQLGKDAERRWKELGYLTLLNGVRLYGNKDDLERRSYKASNQLIQGGVAYLVLGAMEEATKAGIPIAAQVHDEIVADVDETLEATIERARELQLIMRKQLPKWLETRTQPPIFMDSDITIWWEGKKIKLDAR